MNESLDERPWYTKAAAYSVLLLGLATGLFSVTPFSATPPPSPKSDLEEHVRTVPPVKSNPANKRFLMIPINNPSQERDVVVGFNYFFQYRGE